MVRELPTTQAGSQSHTPSLIESVTSSRSAAAATWHPYRGRLRIPRQGVSDQEQHGANADGAQGQIDAGKGGDLPNPASTFGPIGRAYRLL